MASKNLQIQIIGQVKTTVPDAAIPRQRRNLVSNIVVLPRYGEALKGIEDYSHLIVLFWMDKLAERTPPLRIHPRGNQEFPLTGVFATRSAHHPNPIGLAVVELIERRHNCLTVKRLDAFDGTPIIDIKPYDHYDSVADPRVPVWFRNKLLNT